MNTEHNALSLLIRQIIDGLAAQGPQIIERAGGEKPLAFVPDSMRIVELEEHGAAPSRIRQNVSLTSLPSFCELVNRFKEDDSIVFLSPTLKNLSKGGTLATAVIDYHGPDAPKWASNVITLQARPSLAYEKLMELDGELLEQPQFAVAIEDISAFASSISRADLLEIAQTMRLTSKGEFSNMNDEASGSVDFRYNLQVNASAGTSVERRLSVPSNVSFNVAVIDGLPPIDVPVKLLYRAPNGANEKVKLGFKILDRAWLEDAAIQQVAIFIGDATSLPAFQGTFTAK